MTIDDFPWLEDHHRMIRETVRDFCVKEVAPGAVARDRDMKFPRDLFARMAELGLTGVPIPEEWGGAGLDTLAYAITMEEIARVDASLALTLAAHTSLGTYPIYAFGSEEQRKRWVPQLASGKELAAFALTEPDSGSDAQATRTTATEKDGAWVVNGTKFYCTNGSHAKTVVFTAVTGTLPSGKKEITPFVVEKGTPGFRLGTLETKLGMRSSDTRVLHFEEMRLPAENILGGPGQRGKGFHRFMETLDGGRISIGALGVGIAQGALDRALEYSRQRHAFGEAIGDLGAIRERIADMAVDVHAARLLVYDSALRKDRGVPYGRHSAMAKLYSSEAAMRVSDSAIQILGGYGFCREFEVERHYRDAKLCEIGEGTSEVQRIIIARSLAREVSA